MEMVIFSLCLGFLAPLVPGKYVSDLQIIRFFVHHKAGLVYNNG